MAYKRLARLRGALRGESRKDRQPKVLRDFEKRCAGTFGCDRLRGERRENTEGR